jgi:RNA polymerase sigma-70 factor (ECF subfamily)
MPKPEIDTDELLRSALAGDRAAVSALLARHQRRLARMIQKRLDPRMRGRVDTSDVVQETLAAASQRLKQYLVDKPLPFYPWLRQIAWEKLVHLHDRHLRAAKRSVTRERDFGAVLNDESALELAQRFFACGSSPSQAAMRREMRTRIQSALDQLSPSDREVLLLRYLEQLPSKDIAAIMGTTEAAVNMRHMRALERMRKMLID